jgi:hypothetical protein
MLYLSMENWLKVVGFEGLYEVSDRGNVRRVAPWCDGRKNRLVPALAGVRGGVKIICHGI